MSRNPVLLLTLDRPGNIGPFVVLSVLCALMAMQARLPPLEANPVEFPSGSDEPIPGALPEMSVAPDVAIEPNRVPALPQEAVPPDAATIEQGPGVAMMAPAAEAAVRPEANAPAALPPGLGAAMTAGNIHMQTSRGRTVPALAQSLMQQIERLHPARPPAKVASRQAALAKPQSPAPSLRARAPSEGGLGGPARPKGVLGGPNPLAPTYAAGINGATTRRAF